MSDRSATSEGSDRPAASGTGPLAGLRVVELSIAIAAPGCGRMLAHFGADVIKLESRQYPDVVRLVGSAWARTPEFASLFTETSPYLSEMNAGKRSLGLELKRPEALDAARRIIADADVFLTNYSTPAVTALGLGVEALRSINPRLIYLSLPGFGSQPGTPYYEFISWGPNQAPLVGLDELSGYPDQEPAGLAAFAAPDHFAALHAFTSILTGLEQRDRTGEGAWMDLSQFEVTVSALGPFLLDQQLSGHSATRNGNRVSWYAPQGVYPSRGEDRWVAISVKTDQQWAALAGVLDAAGGADGTGAVLGGALAADAALGTLAGRKSAHDDLDQRISAWTAIRSAEEAAARLQQVGVAAHAVHDTEAMVMDPQLREYDWYQVRPSFRFPTGDLFGGGAIRLPDTPGSWTRGAPGWGEHTVEILEQLGLSRQDIDRFVEEGIAFTPVEPERPLKRPYDHTLGPLGLRGGQR
ncbi:MAG: CaiB/BaiF CoA transferase family protein [Acidimicrobiales bacterium]